MASGVANSDKPWDWFYLSANPSISWDVVKANPDKPWKWSYLSANPSITWDVVQANPNEPWDWTSCFSLNSNPTITLEVVKANPDKPWDWRSLSRNPWMLISNGHTNPAEVAGLHHRPFHTVCRRRLMREWDELNVT